MTSREQGTLAASVDSLSSFDHQPPTSARVCIASLEINGPTRNGGIGTAYRTLAEKLANAGHDVTILYLLGSHAERQSVTRWAADFRARGIQFVPLPDSDVPLSGSRSLQLSMLAYRWLASQEQAGNRYHIIHFHEWLGLGYSSLLAKRQGLALQQTRICVGLHSPCRWIQEANQACLDSPELLECDRLERTCAEMADIVWSPSRYLLDWVTAQGWQVRDRAWVHPNPVSFSNSEQERVDTRVCELVFFGRLERRKGLMIFCDALDRLKNDESASSIRIRFLGKSCRIHGEDAAAYVRRRAQNWPFAIRIQTDLGPEEALACLRQPGRVAVIPSISENCPLTVIECLAHRIPFLASKAGGIPELIHDSCHDGVLFPPDDSVLAERFRQVLRVGVKPARPAFDSGWCDAVWDRWHTEQAGLISTASAASGQPSDPLEEFQLIGDIEPLDERAGAMLRRVRGSADAEIVIGITETHTPHGVHHELPPAADLATVLLAWPYRGGLLVRNDLLFALNVEAHCEPAEVLLQALWTGRRVLSVPDVLFRRIAPAQEKETRLPEWHERGTLERDLVALVCGQAVRLHDLEARWAALEGEGKLLRYRLADRFASWFRRIPLLPSTLRFLARRFSRSRGA